MVHEAIEIISCFVLSYRLSLIPIKTVASGFIAGAEIITFFAPAVKCLAASVASLNFPVDSITISTLKSVHGKFKGSFSARTFKLCPSTIISPSLASTSPSYLPNVESYLNK